MYRKILPIVMAVVLVLVPLASFTAHGENNTTVEDSGSSLDLSVNHQAILVMIVYSLLTAITFFKYNSTGNIMGWLLNTLVVITYIAIGINIGIPLVSMMIWSMLIGVSAVIT